MTVTRKRARPQDESIERVLQTMRARFKEMSESQRLLADYMLENPYDIAFTSAAKVGRELGLSSATVDWGVRTSQRPCVSSPCSSTRRCRTASCS